MPSEITVETTETNWVCMIVFLCVHVRISISTYILTSIVTYLPVMSICLVKTERVLKTTFFIPRLQSFFFIFLSRFLTFFNVFFIFFLERFFFTSMVTVNLLTFHKQSNGSRCNLVA